MRFTVVESGKKGQSLTSSGQTAGNASPLFHLKKPMTITTGRKMTSPLLETSFLASQKTNDTFVPYWAENEDKPVCISMENISFFRCDPIIDTLNSFRSNEQVYVLILHEENDFDSFNSFGGFGGFDTFESNEDKNLNQNHIKPYRRRAGNTKNKLCLSLL